jgi:signal transduction histidine kinase
VSAQVEDQVSGRRSTASLRVTPRPESRPVRAFFLTLRGKILLAFLALAAITAVLGRYAVTSVEESGRLVVRTYEKPLMAISYARLAQADFIAMRLASVLREGDSEPARRAQLEARIDELVKSVRDDLNVAEERSSSDRAAAAARQSRHDFDEWNALRLGAANDPAMRQDLHERVETVLASLDNLGELTTDDGFRERQQALASIEAYRRLSIALTVGALLLGLLVAITLARHMVRPIAAASRAARRIAAGELDVAMAPAGRDELGQLLVAMSVMRDNIRGMMEREVAARRSAQGRLVDAIESSPEGVVLVDRERRILIANSQMAAFFPERASDFAEGNDLPSMIDTALVESTAELRLADGRWLRLSRSDTDDGGFVLIASDISLLMEREGVLRAAKEEADRANRAKTDFLTNMSHELRTPLSAIIGFSEMIVSETFGPVSQPKYRDFADDILHSGQHLLEIISEILDVAKLQSGTMEIRLRSLRPRVMIDDAVRIVRKQAQEAGVSLNALVPDNMPMIEGDPVRLRQVLLNLLSNAIKFTPRGGTVSLLMARCREGIHIEVRDTGIGMAPADIPRALEPFGQVDTSLSRRHGGTGLGLPLCKLFVERHGGSMVVHSEPGHGTTVGVILPLVAPMRTPDLLRVAV